MKRTWLPALIAVLLVVAGSSTAMAETATNSQPAWCASQPQLTLAPSPLKPSPNQLPPDVDPFGKPIAISAGLGGYVPVLVVHGIFGRDVHTPARTGAFSSLIDLTESRFGAIVGKTSLIGQLQDIPGSAVYTFDYAPWANQWITDPHIAKSLGEAIDCLYAASHQKVILVAHSMGGLAARLAIGGRAPSGVPRSREVSTVVTFGTPNRGSAVASAVTGAVSGIGMNSAQRGLLAAMEAQCATSTQTDDSSPCALLNRVGSFPLAPGIPALAYQSRQIRAVPAFPAATNVVELGSDMKFDIPNGQWFRTPTNLGSISIGDSLVTTDSSMPDVAKSSGITCEYTLSAAHLTTDSLLVQAGLEAKQDAPQQPFSAFASPCAHGNLLRAVQLTNQALGAVADDIGARHTAFLADHLPTILAPAMCQRPAGKFVDGSLPVADPDMNGGTYFVRPSDRTNASSDPASMNLPMMSIGDQRTGTPGQIALVFGCSAGGVDWPDVIGYYGPMLNYLGSVDLETIDQQEHSTIQSIAFNNGALHVEWATNNDFCTGAAVAVPRSGDFQLQEDGTVKSSNIATGQIPEFCKG